MLAVPRYHPESYPPEGAQYPQFGDPQLDHALASTTDEAHAALSRKRAASQPMHLETLQYHRLMPRLPAPEPEALTPQAPEQHAMESQSDEGYVSAADEEEAPGPSRLRRVASGIGHVVRNHLYPATRDILLPAMGDAAYEGIKGLTWLTGAAVWSAAELFWVLNGGEGEYPEGVGDRSSSSTHALTYPDEDQEEIDRLSKKGKGFLVEELYRKPGWRRVFNQEDSNGYSNDQSALRCPSAI